MRLAWVGCHAEGVPTLEALVAAGAAPVAVLTLPPERAARRSGSADYRALGARLGLPVHETADINDDATVALLRALDLDVLFVIGWGQVLRGPALGTARIGAVGAHASLLPHNRGSAPINWALIRGEPATGNTLLWLTEELDGGAVIDQVRFPITPHDTCATLYDRVAAANRDMILRLLPRLCRGERPATHQPAIAGPLLPRRRPADGRIDWGRPAPAVYDFVRALTRPYPGAFSRLDGRRWTVWQAVLLPDGASAAAHPGRTLGSVVSPMPAACGQAVACATGTVVLLEVEAEDGTVLRGPPLSDQPWAGKVWGDD